MSRATVPALRMLEGFEALQSSDSVKTDLELCHVAAGCGMHLCDVEPDDELVILAEVAVDHLDSCPARNDGKCPDCPHPWGLHDQMGCTSGDSPETWCGCDTRQRGHVEVAA